ncbi:MAG TPA: metallophosphoesterase [Ktedonobacteraceae bacterium]|jgi:DNA repair exonuclease SbcCD nuclease subunit|nr:metallophosphoesterase [Ktedonobacteraceae bacterium]
MAEKSAGNDWEQRETLVPEKHRDGIITIVLTADNHLGYVASGQQPHKRKERQSRLREAFQQATDFAIMQGVDLFIQAGDLFDTTLPDERDRSFVAARLAQLKQAGVKAFALGGVHDTPLEAQGGRESVPAPQLSYARLGALHYFPPVPETENDQYQLEPEIVEVDGIRVGLCGLGVLAGQEGDPLDHVHVQSDIERAHIPLLLLHAPIEGISRGSTLLDTRAQVSRSSIEKQNAFHFILAGYHHGHNRMRIGQSEIVVAGATQHVDFTAPDHVPGFVFLGIAADGIRWCNHIETDSLQMRRLTLNVEDLWSPNTIKKGSESSPTALILKQLHPLCAEDALVQLRLEGSLSRSQYHQLDLNQIRRYGEERCFALAIDDSALELQSEHEAALAETGERFSPREELATLVDEWMTAADEQEKKALLYTKEELLLAMDEMNGSR